MSSIQLTTLNTMPLDLRKAVSVSEITQKLAEAEKHQSGFKYVTMTHREGNSCMFKYERRTGDFAFVELAPVTDLQLELWVAITQHAVDLSQGYSQKKQVEEMMKQIVDSLKDAVSTCEFAFSFDSIRQLQINLYLKTPSDVQDPRVQRLQKNERLRQSQNDIPKTRFLPMKSAEFVGVEHQKDCVTVGFFNVRSQTAIGPALINQLFEEAQQ